MASDTIEEKGMTFQDLQVWQLAREFRRKVHTLSSTLPMEEKYLLAKQMIRSSRSISANIAEGYGRYHFKENIQFCRIARGSLTETMDHLLCAYDCGYIDNPTLEMLNQEQEQLHKLLNGYIKYLSNRSDQV